MAYSFVQSKSANLSGNNAIAATYTTPATAGNLLVAIAGFASTTAPTITGWTALTLASVSGRELRILWKIAAGGETTITTNSVNTAKTLVILEYNPNGATIAVNIENAATNAASTTQTTPTVTATRTGCLTIWGVLALNGSTWSNGKYNASTTGVNNRDGSASGTSVSIRAFDVIAGVSGSNVATADNSISAVGCGAIAVFNVLNAPTVTTSAATSVATTTATGNGNVTSDGGSAITQRGVCWSLVANPTTADSTATTAGTTGSYTASMTGLIAATTYHYRAYAINAVGTSYGADTTFTTNAPPTVALNSPANAATGIGTTPTLNFTGTDADGDTIEYNVQVDTANTFDGTPVTFVTYANLNNFEVHLVSSSPGGGEATMAGGTFTPATTATLTTCQLYTSKTGTPTGNISVGIYNVVFDGSGFVPTGAAIATSDVINVSTLVTGTLTLTTFNFTGVNKITLSSATLYAFMIAHPTGTATSTDYVAIAIDTTSPFPGDYIYEQPAGTFNHTGGLYVSNTILGGASLIDSHSATDAGFTAGHPFASGTPIDYTTQISLTTSITYYWRVRGIDPSGTNTYGAWSSTRSFTVGGGGGSTTIIYLQLMGCG